MDVDLEARGQRDRPKPFARVDNEGPSASVNSFEGDCDEIGFADRASAVVATESPVGRGDRQGVRDADELASTAFAAVRVHERSPTVIASAACRPICAGAEHARERSARLV